MSRPNGATLVIADPSRRATAVLKDAGILGPTVSTIGKGAVVDEATACGGVRSRRTTSKRSDDGAEYEQKQRDEAGRANTETNHLHSPPDGHAPTMPITAHGGSGYTI